LGTTIVVLKFREAEGSDLQQRRSN